jgi:protein-L-isoaspartate(D-aspartate) O-methyltransferase
MTGRPVRTAGFPARLDPGSGSALRPPAHEVLRPQRPVREAALEADQRQLPTGVGLDSQAVRLRMVQRLRALGVTHEAVLAAMAEVPRHLFVDTALAPQAYEDTSLPIGYGQTISKPVVVARMLQLLCERTGAAAPHPLGRVLEVGTGCGYQAAVLARLARRVVSIERVEALHRKARKHLDATGVRDVRLVYGDGRVGHAPLAPYDTVIAAAGGDDIPPVWLEQLALGGRLVAPMHSAAHGGQVLVVVDREEQGLRRSMHGGVNFVPLESGVSRENAGSSPGLSIATGGGLGAAGPWGRS